MTASSSFVRLGWLDIAAAVTGSLFVGFTSGLTLAAVVWAILAAFGAPQAGLLTGEGAGLIAAIGLTCLTLRQALKIAAENAVLDQA